MKFEGVVYLYFKHVFLWSLFFDFHQITPMKYRRVIKKVYE